MILNNEYYLKKFISIIEMELINIEGVNYYFNKYNNSFSVKAEKSLNNSIINLIKNTFLKYKEINTFSNIKFSNKDILYLFVNFTNTIFSVEIIFYSNREFDIEIKSFYIFNYDKDYNVNLLVIKLLEENQKGETLILKSLENTRVEFYISDNYFKKMNISKFYFLDSFLFNLYKLNKNRNKIYYKIEMNERNKTLTIFLSKTDFTKNEGFIAPVANTYEMEIINDYPRDDEDYLEYFSNELLQEENSIIDNINKGKNFSFESKIEKAKTVDNLDNIREKLQKDYDKLCLVKKAYEMKLRGKESEAPKEGIILANRLSKEGIKLNKLNNYISYLDHKLPKLIDKKSDELNK